MINARTSETDSDRRNRAIRGPVLLDSASDEHDVPQRLDIGIPRVPFVADVTDEVTLNLDFVAVSG